MQQTKLLVFKLLNYRRISNKLKILLKVSLQNFERTKNVSKTVFFNYKMKAQQPNMMLVVRLNPVKVRVY